MPALAKKTLRIGVIGYGKMGKLRSELVRRHPALELVAVCDVNYGNSAQAPVQFLPRYEDILALDVDAVMVCTTNDWNARITLQALKAGKHVFCEKPPARTTEELREIIETERQNPHLKLKYGFNHRYHDGILESKALIDSGQLGKVLWARGVYGKAGGNGFEQHWRNQKTVSGGGILLDQGIHMVDLLRHFCGDFNEVKSVVSNRFWKVDVEDNAFALMRNTAGQIAMLHSSSTHWKQQFSLEIYLEQGYAIINGILSQSRGYGRETLIVARRDDPARIVPVPREEITYFDNDLSWQREVDEFTEAILTDQPVHVGHSEDAWKTLQLVEQIYQADPAWRRWTPVPSGPQEVPDGTYSEDVAYSEPKAAGRHVVVSDELHESQVHPQTLYDQYLALSEKDIVQWFQSSSLTSSSCPVCGQTASQPAFSRWGLSYAECQSCATLFVSPRPTGHQLKDYRDQAPSSRFWRERVLAETSESRKEKIFIPRRQWIQSLCSEISQTPIIYADYGSKFEGYLAACAGLPLFERRIAIEPDASLVQACRTHGYELLDSAAADTQLNGALDVVSGFETLNETSSPRVWIERAHGWLRPKGMLVLTAKASSGFDLQLLRERSRNIHPIDHLNLPSVEGVSRMLEQTGFEVIELSTPGQLDVEMVERAYRADPTLPLPRFLKDLMTHRSPDDRRQFQEFLQRARLSSYLRVAARKK
jgi:predicted dehydrogenase